MIPNSQELYDSFEKHRLTLIENLVKKYRTVPQLLGKIEEVVSGTNSGKSPQMMPYYQHWERSIFNALNEMVLHAMAKLFNLMQERSGTSINDRSCNSGTDSKYVPLFKVCTACPCSLTAAESALLLSVIPLRYCLQINVSLSNPEVLVSPTIADIAKILSKLWRNMVESTKLFIRWMDGTCIEAPEQRLGGEDEEPFVFSFYNDIQMNPLVIKAILGLDNPIRQAINSVKQCVPLARLCLELYSQIVN